MKNNNDDRNAASPSPSLGKVKRLSLLVEGTEDNPEVTSGRTDASIPESLVTVQIDSVGEQDEEDEQELLRTGSPQPTEEPIKSTGAGYIFGIFTGVFGLAFGAFLTAALLSATPPGVVALGTLIAVTALLTVTSLVCFAICAFKTWRDTKSTPSADQATAAESQRRVGSSYVSFSENFVSRPSSPRVDNSPQGSSCLGSMWAAVKGEQGARSSSSTDLYLNNSEIPARRLP